jgi:DNA modification methylase
LYTIEGDTVLDPFGGSRITMKVDYYSIIYEINPAYIKIIKDKVVWSNATLDSEVKYDIKIAKPITN